MNEATKNKIVQAAQELDGEGICKIHFEDLRALLEENRMLQERALKAEELLRASRRYPSVLVRNTHTHAILEVSRECFNEVRKRILDAGAGYLLDGDAKIDLNGVAICPIP